MNPDPWDTYCPNCGEDGELAECVSGYFSPYTYIYRCPHCDAFIEDGYFELVRPPK